MPFQPSLLFPLSPPHSSFSSCSVFPTQHIFATVSKENRREIDTIKIAHPADDFVWLDETPVLAFADGVKMLIESGWDEDPPDMDDLSTRAEVRLGQLVKEKYHTGPCNLFASSLASPAC